MPLKTDFSQLGNITPSPVLLLVNCCYVPVTTFCTWKFAGDFHIYKQLLIFSGRKGGFIFYNTVFP